jgi:hypothetical protein
MQRYQKQTRKPKPKKLKESLDTVIPYYTYFQIIIVSILFLLFLRDVSLRIIGDIWLNYDREIVVGEVISTDYTVVHTSTGKKIFYYEIIIDSTKYTHTTGDQKYEPGDTIMVEYVPDYPIFNRPVHYRD